MLIPWIYHQDYDIPLPQNHRFSSSKFGDLWRLLTNSGLKDNSKIFTPKPSTEDDLLQVHSSEYIQKIVYGKLTNEEERILGLPWSETLSKRSFLAVNGTALTCRLALSNGIACHLAGGTHHAHHNFGSGFCVFNDLAFASKSLISEGLCKKILIIDCDVHQGDGTATICNNDPNIFTCSIHAKNNFPLNKVKSDMDIELADDITESDYLDVIHNMLELCLKRFSPDLVIYDAGVDVHTVDRLGRLNISSKYILKRDIKVLSFIKNMAIPIATVIGGGYSSNSLELSHRHSIIFQAVHSLYS
jgi:acetoin utilization deacetylase AcuC-like enzyme